MITSPWHPPPRHPLPISVACPLYWPYFEYPVSKSDPKKARNRDYPSSYNSDREDPTSVSPTVNLSKFHAYHKPLTTFLPQEGYIRQTKVIMYSSSQRSHTRRKSRFLNEQIAGCCCYTNTCAHGASSAHPAQHRTSVYPRTHTYQQHQQARVRTRSPRSSSCTFSPVDAIISVHPRTSVAQ